MKYIKSVLWRVVIRLSYIEDARCLKVKPFDWYDDKCCNMYVTRGVKYWIAMAQAAFNKKKTFFHKLI